LPNSQFIEVAKAIDIDMKLETKAGQLILLNQTCIIWDQLNTDFLLGNDILTTLGIDPKNALDALIGNHDTENIDEIEFSHLEIGEDIDSDIFNLIKSKVNEALSNGLNPKYKSTLIELLISHRDVFRVKLGPDLPACVEPFKTELVKNWKPIKCHARRYTKEQSEFLNDFTTLLQKYGLIYENYNAKWASPVQVVKKPNGYRMCVDLRAVNSQCIATAWPMPFLESIVQYLSKSNYWFILDAFKGFWIMPLAEECQEMFSFMTDRGVFTPTRSIQGALNSATQFQARMTQIYSELLYNSVIIWIDDLLGHAESQEKWLTILSATLKLAEAFNLKFNIEKCQFFLRKVKFCGRIFDSDGVSHDPSRIQILTNMPTPTTARELQQILMASQWMSRSIPNYNGIVYPLQDFFETSMKSRKKRTKAVAGRVKLADFGWNTIHDNAFNSLRDAIATSVQLAYPDQNMIQCVFCDASYHSSSGIVTQIPIEDLNRPFEEQRHQPLGFVGHRFNGSELNWATIDKEAFAIKDTFRKLSYLLYMPQPFRLYTDHRNLISLYNPTRCSKQSAERLIRWGIELRDYNYIIHHIPGEQNHWADLLSRWGAGKCISQPALQLCALQVSENHDTIPPVDSSFRVQPFKNMLWPETSEIAEMQKQYFSDSQCASNSDGLLVDSNGRVLIPIQCENLKLRLCVIAHAGCHSGHLGYHVALNLLKQWVYWVGMERDIRKICSECLHCLPTRKGFRIPRLLGTACHGVRPNQVLHYDYMYIAPNKDDSLNYHWVFVIRDDFSGMVLIRPTVIPNTRNTVDALLEWRAIFGNSEIYVSDQASYFLSQTMKELATRIGTQQHFVTAYAHYSNGSIEIINREILNLLRSLISELRCNKLEWPWLINLIQHTLNHRPQQRLGGRAPITVMAGLPADNPLDSIFFNPQIGTISTIELESTVISQATEKLIESLNNMHKDIFNITEIERMRHRQQSSRDRFFPNFGVGDYVLVAIPEKQHGNKLTLAWHGPYRVTDTHKGYVFSVENLLTNEIKEIHGDRIQFYSDNNLNITEEILNQLAYDTATHEIDEIQDCRINSNKTDIEFLVKLRGFDNVEDIWCPGFSVRTEKPEAIQQFLLKNPNHPLNPFIRTHILPQSAVLH
jgi:hypothetical protein